MQAIRNFFADEDRCYDRRTTAMLTDFAGIGVIVALTVYFSVVGILTYNELVVNGGKW